MNTHVKVFIVLLMLGTLGIIGLRVVLPMLQEQQQLDSSDASGTRGSILLGADSWIGYYPLCSPDMQRAMRGAGYLYRCEQDAGDYHTRFRRLQKGELQFAVATVDSWLLAGAPLAYPGTIIAVIDQSAGGDALVGWKDSAPSLEALKGMDNLRVAYTPESPSAHLLKAVADHFGIDTLRRNGKARKIETDGSGEALKKLLDKDADVAVLWEPDVSRALAQPGIAKLIGSDDTEGLIVDVLLVGREYSVEHPEAVQTLVETYFKVRQELADDRDRLRRQVQEETGLELSQVDAMLGGVRWATLQENAALWFSPTRGKEELIDSIQSSLGIILRSGDLASNPLPGGDPYRITNRQFIEGLGGGAAAAGVNAVQFTPLDAAGWARLRPVASLKIEPIGFQRGTADLSEAGRQELDQAAQTLRHYPRFRILVAGHTGVRGDAEANRTLSQQRADAVSRYLIDAHQFDPNRIGTVGYGGDRPLARQKDESDRAWGFRLPRVELVLLGDNL